MMDHHDRLDASLGYEPTEKIPTQEEVDAFIAGRAAELNDISEILNTELKRTEKRTGEWYLLRNLIVKIGGEIDESTGSTEQTP